MEYDTKSIRHRQQLFLMTMKSYFMGKLEKYHGLIVKHGIHIDYQTMECLTKSFSFEDNINLILDESSASLEPRQAFKKFGNRLSVAKFFRWIYFLVQRTKAARILSHLNGVSQSEIKDVVVRVGTELGVSYEYQLMMLQGDLEVIKLARHAVTCMMAHLNGTGSAFSVKDLLQAVLEVKPRSSRDKELLKVHPLHIGGKVVALKWKLGQVFKQPGLRINTRELEAELIQVYEDTDKGIEVESYSRENNEIAESISIDSMSSIGSANVKNHFIGSDENGLELYKEKINKDDKPDINGSFEDVGIDEVDNATIMKQHHEKFEIGLHDVSTVLLGQIECFGNLAHREDSGPSGRRISAIEMDYDEGKLYIEDHIVAVEEDIPETDHAEQSFEEEETKPSETRLDRMGMTDSFIEENSESCVELYTEKESFNPDKTLEDILDNEDESNIDKISEKIISRSKSVHEIKQINDQENVEYRVDSQFNKMNLSSYSPIKDSVDLDFKFYGCFTPYGAKCRPGVFGFRGPLRVLEGDGSRWSLLYGDKVTIRCKRNTELPLQTSSPHMTYIPKTRTDGRNIVLI